MGSLWGVAEQNTQDLETKNDYINCPILPICDPGCSPVWRRSIPASESSSTSTEYAVVWDTEYVETETQECQTVQVKQCSTQYQKQCVPKQRQECKTVYK